MGPKKSSGHFWVVLVATGLILGISAFGFTFRYYDFEKGTGDIAKIEKMVNDLRAAMNVDAVRQANIQKVMALIEKYNPKMPSDMRYNIANEVYEMSIKYTNLDVNLICATITHESAQSWNPKVTSPVGAMGLMQIMPGTGMFLAEVEGIPWVSPETVLFNPIYNIRLGCRYLSTLIDIYGVEGGLAAYNGGEKRASMWLAHNKANGILWPETQKYVPAILNLYRQFQN